jgi:peptidoglycan/LPS O-acetylase OafA/YrhL
VLVIKLKNVLCGERIRGGSLLINSLTSFRFIAALMVFIFHLGLFTQYQLGAAGVSFFFVLSGFILAFNYHNKFEKIDKTRLKKFYLARFAKIYPVHVLTFLIAVPISLVYFNPDGLYLIKLAFMSFINLALIQSYIPSQGTYFNFNGVSWTLSVEALFYLTFPFLLLFFNKIKVNKHKIITIGVFILLWSGLFSLNMNLNEENHFLVWMLHIFPLARLFEFALGVTLGLIFVSSLNHTKPTNHIIYSLLELFSLALFIISLEFSTQFDIGAVRGGFFIPIWCILIFVFAKQGGIFSKILSNKFLVYLGEISFSFYMVHQLVIRYYEFFGFNESYKVVTSFGLTVMLSALIYKYYEEPLRKWIRFGKSGSHKNIQISSKASA